MNATTRKFRYLRGQFGRFLDLMMGTSEQDDFSKTTRLMLDSRSRPIATSLVIAAAVVAVAACIHIYQQLWFSAVISTLGAVCLLHYARTMLRQEKHPLSDIILGLVGLTVVISGIHTVGATAVMWFYPLVLAFHIILSPLASKIFNRSALIVAPCVVYFETESYLATFRSGATLALTIGATQLYAFIVDVQQRRLKEQATELDKKNAALSNAIRSREDAERIARHDLKTPLSAIAAAPDLIRAGRAVSGDEENVLSMIEKAANRALRLVNLSLDFYRMEMGTYVFRPRPVDLTAVVHEVVQDLSSHARSKAVRIEVSGDAPSVFVEGEDALCYSIIANLIKNAVEAAPEDSVVHILFQVWPGVRLGIQNAGAVPESLRNRFFAKYVTADKVGGFGLGTYSSYLMASVQNAELTMETSEKLGTTLMLEMERALAPEILPDNMDLLAGSDELGTDVPTSGIGLTPHRVLIVDDDNFNRMVLGKQLPQPPLLVESAINGRVALQLVQKQRPDIIFMDIEMPIMGGIEALVKIRDYQKAAGQMPSLIVAFTSNDDAESQTKYLATGFDRCLGKPSSRQDVLALLSSRPVAAEPKVDISTDSEMVDISTDSEIVLDRDLAEDLPNFLMTRRALVGELSSVVVAEDWESARKIAHKLAGSLGLFGFAWASSSCKEIEKAVMAGELSPIREKVEKLASHLDSVKVVVGT